MGVLECIVPFEGTVGVLSDNKTTDLEEFCPVDAASADRYLSVWLFLMCMKWFFTTSMNRSTMSSPAKSFTIKRARLHHSSE